MPSLVAPTHNALGMPTEIRFDASQLPSGKAATFPMRAASARRIKWADEPSAGPGSCLHTVHLITPRSERLEVELLPIDGGDRDDDLPEYALPAATSFTSALRSALCRCL